MKSRPPAKQAGARKREVRYIGDIPVGVVQ
jgi:hypothetical protein